MLRLWRASVLDDDALKGLHREWHAIDGAMPNAPLGGEKTGPNPTDRGKSGTRRSRLTDGDGIPRGVALDGANRNAMQPVAAPVCQMVIGLDAPGALAPQPGQRRR